ncbi:MAG: ribulokinase [Oscillospiraceae bacterium]|jgi:L-ribulokinase|nr:ribulokinase [Oscillospiraceae bacterium]
MKYCLGLDFGSLSARALLVAVETGEEVASAVAEYRHGFIETALPETGETLPPDWTLQDPKDYIDALSAVCHEVTQGIDPSGIVGVGVDFTSCTMLPVTRDGIPLSYLPEFRENKHAYVKKWKHHAAQDQADRLNALARERGEGWLPYFGGKMSCEFMLPKMLQILEEAPEVYTAAAGFVEAGDWIVWVLTGALARSSCMAGYKSGWTETDGYPSNDFLTALHPGLNNAAEEKLWGDVVPVTARAGLITEEAAKLTGLAAGTPVGIAVSDALAAVPAAGITRPGTLLKIIGTSTCDIILTPERTAVQGMCGNVPGAVIPGLYGLELGQSCVGDHFDWFVRTCVPGPVAEEAKGRGISVHTLLSEKAAADPPGASGLLALDWWNGNRSVLTDTDLTGLMVGLSLTTRPEEIYRALIEATAFGAKVILDAVEEAGVPVERVRVCGGIPLKNPFMMQCYADILNREISVSRSSQACALGSAMLGAVAAGKAGGGFDTIQEAAEVMPRIGKDAYAPNPAHRKVYDALYSEYRTLHDLFGRGGSGVMKNLKAIKRREFISAC